KLSLLLKALEGETKESIDAILFHKERALPDLAKNIRCGNSIIGRDFYNGQQRSLLDDKEQHRINVFDWRGEKGFPEIMAAGGFDAIIGNPPYIRMETFKELKNYLRLKYKVHDERADLYAYFIEREHQLLREGGMFGMIVSNKFLRANYGRNVRDLIVQVAQPLRIVDLAGLPVFRGATVRTIILITERSNRRVRTRYSPPPDRETFQAIQAETTTLAEATDPTSYALPAQAVKGAVWNLVRPNVTALMRKMEQDAVMLSEFVDGNICMGIKSGLIEAFVISGDQMRRIVKKNAKAKKLIHPFLQGRCIDRYKLEPADEYLIYTPHGIDMSPYPAVLDHLSQYRKSLEQRATNQEWYELQQPQFAYKKWMESPKIVFPDIATSVRFAIDRNGYFGANTVYFIPTDNLMLLGLLNSRAAAFYFKQVCAALEGPGEAYLRFFGQYLESFPVKLPKSEQENARLIRHVEEIFKLQKESEAARIEHSRAVYERILDHTNQQIDALVYELYGLTPEEIALVEEATK
ncbi:MAG: TaqI-like C-terminal specificity domain-containing protein, partial [Pirellulales bacterium]